MKKTALPAIAAILLSAVTLTACSQPTSFPDVITVQNADSATNVISVQASEKVSVVPDIAEITFSISTQSDNAKDCQTKNGEDLDRVIKLLETQGIESKSMQTSNYGLNPIYDWNNGQTITGYQMETSLTVSDIPMDQAGTLISACVEAGVNSIQNVTYLSSKYDESYQEALGNAIKTARTKANAIAAADGRSITDMIHVGEMSDNQTARYTGYRASGSAKEMGQNEAAAMDVVPGQLDVEAQVTVEFMMQ